MRLARKIIKDLTATEDLPSPVFWPRVAYWVANLTSIKMQAY
jgi:hypothetical protein